MRTYGLESEKAVSSMQTGQPHLMSQAVFKRLSDAAVNLGQPVDLHHSDLQPELVLGVVTPCFGEQGVDNSYNLQETALPYTSSLHELASRAAGDAETVGTALAEEGATFLNMSNHPLGSTDKDTYAASVAPKSLYTYLRFRGWDHTAGIDAKAHNSPATSVNAYEAADSVSVMIGAGAGLIGLFGNSPFAEGRPAGVKESRLTMWDRMMQHSKVAGDRIVAQFPAERFRTMGDYFTWMFGGQTGIHFVLSEGQDYKTLGDRILIVEGDPPVLDYLTQPSWGARRLPDILAGSDQAATTVTPNISHMVTMQFAQFNGARIRYDLPDDFPLQEFLEGCKRPASRVVEQLFDQYAPYIYIEGRDAGSNFPDEQIWAAGADIAKSVIISPSAIQAGLIRNLEEATAFIDSFDWELLGKLREAAIGDGLDGEAGGVQVKEFAARLLDIAARGLEDGEQWMLAYPRWVLQTGQNGADRAIEYVRSSGLPTRDALAKLVTQREVRLS